MNDRRMMLDNGTPSAPDLVPTTLGDFLETNAAQLDPADVQALAELQIGETFRGDEGVGGFWTLTRLPD